MFDIILIIIILVVVDFAYTGFLPVLFGLFASVREIDRRNVIMAGGVSQVQYPVDDKWTSFWINHASGLKLILTQNTLYIQNTHRSYATKLAVENMREFSMMRKDMVGKVFGNRITIKLESGESFNFRSEEIDSWRDALLKLGIKESE